MGNVRTYGELSDFKLSFVKIRLVLAFGFDFDRGGEN